MHARLQRAIDKGDIDITDFWQQGDGHQDVKLFCRKVEQVLLELLSDERLDWCQQCAFNGYRNPSDNMHRADFINVLALILIIFHIWKGISVVSSKFKFRRLLMEDLPNNVTFELLRIF
jgi:hypothetical protein